LFYKWDRMKVENVFSSYQETQTGTISKGDREMSVCEMQRELNRADFLTRTARNEVAVARWEQAGSKGARPPAPSPDETPDGIGKAYCRLLAVFAVREASALFRVPKAPARTPQPASQSAPLDARASTPLPAGIVPALDSGARLPDEAGLKARLDDAEYRLADSKRERNRYDVEIQKKFSLAAACVIFVLIGAPIALRFPRGGVGLVIGVSFAIFGIYYVGLIGGETLADKDYLPPWLAMWGVNILLALAGLGLAMRMGRESTTTRGGDFAELLLTTRARVLGWARRFGVPVERRRR
jgi:lipopolysaccharide export system permease protein